MEWERQRTYDFENGKEAGKVAQAIEDAVIAVKEFKVTPEFAAEKMNVPLELVLEELKKNTSE